MNKGQLDMAIRRARNLFDRWNDCTGVIAKGSSYYHECLACIDDAVHCGAQAATGDVRTLPGEDDERPDPDAEWREEMMQAWRDGELETKLSGGGMWVPWREHSSCEPAFDAGRWNYRRRPKPTTRPWNCPEDVPAFCWIRDTRGNGYEYIGMVVGIESDPAAALRLRVGQATVICDGQFHHYEYSTDRRTWLPCTTEVKP